MWRNPDARLTLDQEVAGSNPAVPVAPLAKRQGVRLQSEDPQFDPEKVLQFQPCPLDYSALESANEFRNPSSRRRFPPHRGSYRWILNMGDCVCARIQEKEIGMSPFVNLALVFLHLGLATGTSRQVAATFNGMVAGINLMIALLKWLPALRRII